jgi:hypothetical protein
MGVSQLNGEATLRDNELSSEATPNFDLLHLGVHSACIARWCVCRKPRFERSGDGVRREWDVISGYQCAESNDAQARLNARSGGFGFPPRVAAQYPAQMRLAINNGVIQAFAANGPDQSFGKSVLPWRGAIGSVSNAP